MKVTVNRRPMPNMRLNSWFGNVEAKIMHFVAAHALVSLSVSHGDMAMGKTSLD